MFKIIALTSALLLVSEAASIPTRALFLSPLSTNTVPVVVKREAVEESYPPQPYSFGYETVDDYGTRQSRSESGDENGNVKGSYSFSDKQGITRTVDYVADKSGFRAQVRTNEPGTARSEPADVRIDADPIVIPYVPRSL